MDMSERIELAKKKAEQEYQKKLIKSQASDIDVRDFFSDEELMRLLNSEMEFKGNVVDISKHQRYKKLATAAKWMDANSIEVINIEVEKPTPSRPNVIVSMKLRHLCSFRGQELKVFTLMSALADSVYLSAIKEDGVKITFGVEKVWMESAD